MTTIAWDGVTLAADTQSQTGGAIDQTEEQKIFRRKGAVFAIAGDVAQARAVIDWLVSDTERPIFQSNEFEVVVINEDGGFCYSEEFYPFDIRPPFATGSGSHFALGVMVAGGTAKEAVEAAIKLDTQTGGKVRAAKTHH